jgi:hypothetical protein
MRNLVVMYDSKFFLLAKFDVNSRWRICSVAYKIKYNKKKFRYT